MPTKIEWCDETINPIIGCKRQCSYCYASRQATRLARFPHTAERYAGIAEGGKWTGVQRFVPSELEKLARWKKTRRVFIGSMGDLGDAPSGDVYAVLDAVVDARRHTCMMLTKNPERLGVMIRAYLGGHPPLPNLQVGASVTDQPTADERIPLLLNIPAAVRFVSVEPMLSAVDLDYCPGCGTFPGHRHGMDIRAPDGSELECGPTEGPPVDWVIAGAETGPGKRPAELEWFRDTRNQCKAAGVPFFMKKTSDGDPPEDLMIHELPWEETP